MNNTDYFRYKSFSVNEDRRIVDFSYELSHAGTVTTLNEVLIFENALQNNTSISRALRALHIALGISYYKIFIPPIIEQPYDIDEAEVQFWNTVFKEGLGEFLYVNNLRPNDIASFEVQTGITYMDDNDASYDNKALLGIGGGKDSIVAGELLKSLAVRTDGFVMATGEQLGQSKEVAGIMGVKLHAVNRTLDKKLLSLQGMPGAYKGHVPISLIFGLVGAVLAINQNASYIVVANEASASIPGIMHEGKAVNHQWSKSFDFEKTLQSYIQSYIDNQVTYFSAIRPLTSVAVAKRFADYPAYFEAFTSDNYIFRIDPAKRPHGRWSLESAKSLSSFILLAPWMTDEDILKTFGRNFLNETSLEKLFLELTGVEGQPPLDCVGTVEELILSLNLLANQGRYTESHLMQLAVDKQIVKEDDWDSKLQELLMPVQDEAFPEDLKQKLYQELNS